MRFLRDFWEDCGLPIIVVLGVMGILIVCLFFVLASMNRVECSNLTEVTKRRTDFRWLGGCYVEHEGEMLPYERWKLLDVRVTNRK